MRGCAVHADRERALKQARAIWISWHAPQPGGGLPGSQVSDMAAALLEAEARGVEWAYERFRHPMLSNRAAELRAQMSEKSHAESAV